MSIGSIFQKKMRAGLVIFSQGEAGDAAYIIDSGRVEILVDEGDGDQISVAVLGPGEIFGEMSIIDGSARSATARCLDDCHLSIVKKGQLEKRVENADPIVRLLISMLFKRIKTNNFIMAQNKVSDATELTELVDLSIEDNSGEGLSIEEGEGEALKRIRFESDLLQAIENEEFSLFYQPIVNLSDYSLAGMEALVRWNSGKRGFVRPDIFMNVAEDSALVVPIGRWVYENACKNLSIFSGIKNKSNMVKEDFFMSVNISGRQFADPEFFEYIKSEPEKYSLAYKRVKLEVTERIFMQGPDVTHWLKKCRELGLPVILDDFGTGYSSLSYLTKFEVDQIKIDKSFVDNIHQSHKSLTISQSISNLSRGLGMTCVAEGIEKVEQMQVIQRMGCELGQGYLFSRPIDFPKMCDLLQNWDKIVLELDLEGSKAA